MLISEFPSHHGSVLGRSGLALPATKYPPAPFFWECHSWPLLLSNNLFTIAKLYYTNETYVKTARAWVLILDHIFLPFDVSNGFYWMLEIVNCTLLSV